MEKNLDDSKYLSNLLSWQKNQPNIGPNPTADQLANPRVHKMAWSVPLRPADPPVKPSKWLSQYSNAKYKGCSLRRSNEMLVQAKLNEEVARFMERSRFFSKTGVDDGEADNRRAVVNNELKNPEQIADKKLEKEAEDAINNMNSIAKPFMTDTGTATFDYDPPDDDQVGIVQSSNQSYTKFRDRFFQPPQGQGDLASMLQKIKEPQIKLRAGGRPGLSTFQATSGGTTQFVNPKRGQ